jgi:hypothetical protein
MQPYEVVIGDVGEMFVNGLQVGSCENVEVAFSKEVKFHRGDLSYPRAAIAGAKSCTVKAEKSTFDGKLFCELHGISPAPGETLLATESFPAGASAVLAHAATIVGDPLEVRNSLGQRMVKVTSSPAAGVSYQHAAGTLTYAGTEQATTVKYQHTDPGGFTGAILNSSQGLASTVRIDIHNVFAEASKPMGLRLWKVVPTKLPGFSFKAFEFGAGFGFEGEAMEDTAQPLVNGQYPVGNLFWENS